MRVRASEKLAGAMSIVAGLLHGGLSSEHFEIWWGYGLFFVVAATAQVLLGLALLTDAIEPRGGPIATARAKRRLYLAGLAGQLALVAIYALSRATGVPWFGPAAGVVEPVAPIDAVTKLLEIGCAGALGWLLARPRVGAASPSAS